MLYYLVRPLARLALKFFFTKIHLVNQDRVPQSDPVLMAINHPTIFTEPILMACYQSRALFFLAKGVLFIPPFVRLLKSLHLIPLFRKKDGGIEKRRGNLGSFDYCYKIFNKNGAVLIMPEGSSELVRQLRPFNKGFTKLAFGYYEKNKDTRLKILPVGVNFSDADKFRGEVSFGFGQPIEIQDYAELYQSSPRKATEKLMQDLYIEMEKQVVHVKNPEDLFLVDQILRLIEHENPIDRTRVVVKNSDKIDVEKRVTKIIEEMSIGSKEALKTKTQSYFIQLEQSNLSDYALIHEERCQIGTLLFLILTHPIFLLGWVTNALTYAFGLFCGSKAHDVETRMSVVMGMTFGFYLLYYPVAILIGWMLGMWPLVLTILFPILGYFAIHYLDLAREYMAALKVRKSPQELINRLRDSRAEILKKFN